MHQSHQRAPVVVTTPVGSTVTGLRGSQPHVPLDRRRHRHRRLLQARPIPGGFAVACRDDALKGRETIYTAGVAVASDIDAGRYRGGGSLLPSSTCYKDFMSPRAASVHDACIHARCMRLSLHVTFKCRQRPALGSTFNDSHPSVHTCLPLRRYNTLYSPFNIHACLPHTSSPLAVRV